MSPLTEEQFQKITLIDTLLGSVSVDQLRELAESAQIVSRLKGTENNPQILMTLIQEHHTLMLDYLAKKLELQSLKDDFQALIKVLHADVFTPRYNQDFNNLKSKHGVY